MPGRITNAGRRGVKRVPHVARGVVLGHVQQLEVVLVGFDFAGPVNLKTHVGEDAVDSPQDLRREVQSAR